MENVVLVGAARTAMAGFQGEFSALGASELGGAAIGAALEGAGVAPNLVDELFFGGVLPGGIL
jgi:Thiolase, N-terminal domain.